MVAEQLGGKALTTEIAIATTFSMILDVCGGLL